ncbi:hypothetical protein [Thermonema sp.]|uniref:hypothetical protein n=1 Tax=Thermonema sp. TaxID=2231181 RepID=UPI0025880D6F|nr:hypothetical protein [Thermonema sp.]
MKDTMNTSFEQMPADARLWVYPAGRPLSSTEQQSLLQEVHTFLQNWRAHGKPLRAAATVVEDYFLLVAADPHAEPPSGCSIDAQVGFIRQLAQHYDLAFLERGRVYFRAAGGIDYLPLGAVKEAVTEGRLTAETPVYKQEAATKAEWGCVPAVDTWLKRYFAKTKA